MESYGNRQLAIDQNTDGNVFGTYHWANKSGQDLHCGGSTPEQRCSPWNFSGSYPGQGIQADFSTDFHVFTIDWNSTSITWSVDGTPYWERHNGDRPGTDHSAQICSHEMYIILNTAIQANPPLPANAPRYPVTHVVDWVKVWEWIETEPLDPVATPVLRA
jgi:beta-glucanase (GH16 family)